MGTPYAVMLKCLESPAFSDATTSILVPYKRHVISGQLLRVKDEVQGTQIPLPSQAPCALGYLG